MENALCENLKFALLPRLSLFLQWFGRDTEWDHGNERSSNIFNMKIWYNMQYFNKPYCNKHYNLSSTSTMAL